MEIYLRDNIRIIQKMVMVSKYINEVISMKEHLKVVNKMEWNVLLE